MGGGKEGWRGRGKEGGREGGRVRQRKRETEGAVEGGRGGEDDINRKLKEKTH